MYNDIIPIKIPNIAEWRVRQSLSWLLLAVCQKMKKVCNALTYPNLPCFSPFLPSLSNGGSNFVHWTIPQSLSNILLYEKWRQQTEGWFPWEIHSYPHIPTGQFVCKEDPQPPWSRSWAAVGLRSPLHLRRLQFSPTQLTFTSSILPSFKVCGNCCTQLPQGLFWAFTWTGC